MTTVNDHLTIGLQQARSHNYGKAENEFDLLLSSDRTNPLGLYYRGCTRIYLNKFELAVEDFNLAISSLKLSLERELGALYKRGIAYQKLYKFDFALDNYRKFLNQAKENNKDEFIHKAYFSIGTMHAALNRHEEAVRYFDDAIRTSGGSSEDRKELYYLHRGRARAFCANFNEAVDDFRIVILHSKDHLLKGCAYNELGQHEKALQEYNRWYESSSRNDNKLSPLSLEILDDHVQFRRGLTYASLNGHDNALADYQYIFDKSNRLTSSTIADRIFFRKGMSIMALNDAHEALINFNKSILLNSSQSDVFYARGMLHFTLGRHDAAVYDHRQALELGESNYSIIPSIYQTLYHTHNYNPNNVDPRIFHQKQVREAEAALKHCKETRLPPEEHHRRIAEYQQQLAPYMPNPEETHREAEKHIRQALQPPTAKAIYDKMTLAINHCLTSEILSNKYPAGIASERIVKKFIKSSMESIVEMSEILEKCALENNWNDLFNAFYELKDILPTKTNNPFVIFRSEYIQIEFKKAELIKKTSEKFKDSRQQHDFYTLLVIRLCNLFDATRTATTGIFQHALTGTFTKISYVPKLLGFLSDFLPVGSNVVKTGLGICGDALKKIDETRIQNALTHVGCLDQQEKLNDAASTISEKLTIMYELQIKRFPPSKGDVITRNDEEKTSCCGRCCQSCSKCFTKSKSWLLNERENSNIQSIVQYAFELLVNSLTDLEISKVNDVADLNDFFYQFDMPLVFSTEDLLPYCYDKD
ncbi:unnamed protein product [Rotaria magnacalcarata]|uniref:Uncharacterized protein n=1 Tax=Rotaria magnacalcarata TaxID=392030 RepID=A0A816V031_9BILA|nr:unnamed protein product [Rotaria magnacalcarata]